MDVYAYSRLPRDSKHIRIIKLQPSSTFQAVLHCEIVTEELIHTGSPAFDAISYAWEGQIPSQDHFILCHEKGGENKKLLVTRNCDAVLRHVRLENDIRAIWIDSVCIDQATIQEKNHQVGLMGDIYKYARKVIVWLGEDPTLNGKRVFQNLQMLAGGDLGNINAIIENMMEGFTPQLDRMYGWSVIGEIFGRPWFTRMWTLQELALADAYEALLLCGEQSIKFGEVVQAHDRLVQWKSEKPDNGHVDKKYSHYRVIADAIEAYCLLHSYIDSRRTAEGFGASRRSAHPNNQEKPMPLISSIFDIVRRKEATDPKDKVFALYGLCKELGMLMPHPDYTKDLRQIYSEVTKSIIQHDAKLNVLYMIKTPRRRGDLPSWVPDWSDYWRTEGNYPINYASLYQASIPKTFYSFDSGCKTLTVLGKVVDAISWIGKEVPVLEENPGPWGPDFDNQSSLQLWKTFQEWAQFVEKWAVENTIPYGDYWANKLAFYFTITQGTSKRDSTIKEDLRSDIKSFGSWYEYLVNGEKELEKELLEQGMTPKNITAEFLSSMNETCALLFDGKDLAGNFQYKVWGLQRGKTFFVTQERRLGTVEGQLHEGDMVALIAGLEMPLILSPVEEQFQVVGHGYVHGIMDGELWPEALEELRLISLI